MRRYTRRRFDRLVALVGKLNAEKWEIQLGFRVFERCLVDPSSGARRRRGRLVGLITLLERELVNMCLSGSIEELAYCYRCGKVPGVQPYEDEVWCSPCYGDHTRDA